MLEVIQDTVIDGIRLLPFLFIAYLIMEYLEHKTGEKTKKVIKKSGKYGPILGGILGIFPQCGFSAVAANLYAGRVITIGTLIAIFLSTSDEMLPILISEGASITIILQILAIKAVVGIISGIVIDFIILMYRKAKQKEVQEEEKIEELCEHDHCDCKDGNILKATIVHTIQIFLFILIITFIINTIIYFIGEETISGDISNIPIVGNIIAAVVGLIPNCAGSVILTQLYLENVISMGAMVSGLLVGSGIGILILFKVNKNIKDNLKITAILYVIGVIAGILIDIIL